MAIKEFEIKPQNYWEDGYFQGDYVEPLNQSFASVTCDADRILGGLFEAGFYFEENYIDRTYTFVNSILFTLTAEAMVVQEAEISLQGYYETGYYDTGYFQRPGSYFTLTAELEKVGQDLFGEATLAVNTSVSATVGIVREYASALTVTTTQTATISHIFGADLFAFTEADLEALANAIRDYNSSLDSIFDIAVDYVAIRTSDSLLTAFANIDTQILRSRDHNSDITAAFSLTADSNVIANGAGDITAEFDLDVSLGVTIQSQSLLAVESNLLIEETVIVELDESNLNSNSTLSANAIVYQLRDRNRPKDFFRPNTVFFNTDSKFGTHSFQSSNLSVRLDDYIVENPTVGQDWVLEGWVKLRGFENFLRSANFGTSSIRLQLSTPSNTLFKRLRSFVVDNDFQTEIIVENLTVSSPTSPGGDGWDHVALVTSGSTTSVYYNGSRKATTTLTTEDFLSSFNDVSISTQNSGYLIDHISFAIGSTYGWNANNSSINIPSTPRQDTANTIFLYRLDNNLLDDYQGLGLTFDQSATASAVIQLQSNINVNYDLNQTIASEFTLTALAGVDRGADLVAFSASELTAEATVFRGIESQLESLAQQNVTIDIFRNFDAQLQSTVDLSALGSRQLETSSLLAVNTSLTAFAQTTSETLLVLHNFATVDCDVTRIHPGAGLLESQANLTADGIKAVDGESDLTVVSNVTTINDTLRLAESDLTVTAETLLVPGNAIGFDIGLTSTAELAVAVDIFRDNQANVDVTSTLTSEVTRIQSAQADLDLTATTSTLAVKTTDVDSDFAAVATVNVVVQTTTETIIQLFDDITLTAVPEVTRDHSSSLTAVFDQTNITDRFADNTAEIESTVSLTANGTRKLESASDLTVTATITATTAIVSVDQNVYQIPRETRTWVIAPESRQWQVNPETRTWIIKK